MTQGARSPRTGMYGNLEGLYERRGRISTGAGDACRRRVPGGEGGKGIFDGPDRLDHGDDDAAVNFAGGANPCAQNGSMGRAIMMRVMQAVLGHLGGDETADGDRQQHHTQSEKTRCVSARHGRITYICVTGTRMESHRRSILSELFSACQANALRAIPESFFRFDSTIRSGILNIDHEHTCGS